MQYVVFMKLLGRGTEGHVRHVHLPIEETHINASKYVRMAVCAFGQSCQVLPVFSTDLKIESNSPILYFKLLVRPDKSKGEQLRLCQNEFCSLTAGACKISV